MPTGNTIPYANIWMKMCAHRITSYAQLALLRQRYSAGAPTIGSSDMVSPSEMWLTPWWPWPSAVPPKTATDRSAASEGIAGAQACIIFAVVRRYCSYAARAVGRLSLRMARRSQCVTIETRTLWFGRARAVRLGQSKRMSAA